MEATFQSRSRPKGVKTTVIEKAFIHWFFMPLAITEDTFLMLSSECLEKQTTPDACAGQVFGE